MTSTANKHLAANPALLRQAQWVLDNSPGDKYAFAEFARAKGCTAQCLRKAMAKAGYGRSARGMG
jgi:hypothetical protein